MTVLDIVRVADKISPEAAAFMAGWDSAKDRYGRIQMAEPQVGYEEFEEWVNEYRNDNDLHKLSDTTMRECYEILISFNSAHKEARK